MRNWQLSTDPVTKRDQIVQHALVLELLTNREILTTSTITVPVSLFKRCVALPLTSCSSCGAAAAVVADLSKIMIIVPFFWLPFCLFCFSPLFFLVLRPKDSNTVMFFLKFVAGFVYFQKFEKLGGSKKHQQAGRQDGTCRAGKVNSFGIWIIGAAHTTGIKDPIS